MGGTKQARQGTTVRTFVRYRHPIHRTDVFAAGGTETVFAAGCRAYSARAILDDSP